jgi:phospholipid transport system substrate-binding protein
MIKRRTLGHWTTAASMAALLAGLAPGVRAADEAPDALIRRLSEQTLAAIKADPALRGGDMSRIIALVDGRIMPNVNFQRMTAQAVGPAWRQASPEQRRRIQDFAGAHLLGRALAGQRRDHRGATLAGLTE